MMFGSMMGSWGMGYGIVGFLTMVLFWIIVIAAIVYAVRWLSSGSTARSTGASEAPIEILKRRYAKGEIDHDEFVARKQELV